MHSQGNSAIPNTTSPVAKTSRTARKLLFTVGAHEGLKCGSESGRKGVDLPVFLNGLGVLLVSPEQGTNRRPDGKRLFVPLNVFHGWCA